MSKTFYHFTVTPLLKGVPRLITKVCNSDHKILIVCENEEQMRALDNELWTFSTKEFIPHDIYTCESPQSQQVLLALDSKDNLNKADVLVLYNQTANYNISEFQKVIYVFYGNSDEDNVIQMMDEYKKSKQRSGECVLWEQSSSAQWVNN